MEFYSRYNPAPQVYADTYGPTLTEQKHKQDCDINNILRRYSATGELIHTNPNMPSFDDFTNVPEFREMLDFVNYAHEQFAELPSDIRERFNNNPVRLVDFVNNEKNRDEAIRIGLIKPPNSQNLEGTGQ